MLVTLAPLTFVKYIASTGTTGHLLSSGGRPAHAHTETQLPVRGLVHSFLRNLNSRYVSVIYLGGLQTASLDCMFLLQTVGIKLRI